MNKQRRKDIAAIVEDLSKVSSLVTEIMEAIQSVADEESDYYENMPDGLKEGEKGQDAERANDALSTARDSIESIDSELQAVESALQTAME